MITNTISNTIPAGVICAWYGAAGGAVVTTCASNIPPCVALYFIMRVSENTR